LEQEPRRHSSVTGFEKNAPITELRSKYSGRKRADEDHEERQENAGWIVLKRICQEQGSQNTVSQRADDEFHYTGD